MGVRRSTLATESVCESGDSAWCHEPSGGPSALPLLSSSTRSSSSTWQSMLWKFSPRIIIVFTQIIIISIKTSKSHWCQESFGVLSLSYLFMILPQETLDLKLRQRQARETGICQVGLHQSSSYFDYFDKKYNYKYIYTYTNTNIVYCIQCEYIRFDESFILNALTNWSDNRRSTAPREACSC